MLSLPLLKFESFMVAGMLELFNSHFKVILTIQCNCTRSSDCTTLACPFLTTTLKSRIALFVMLPQIRNNLQQTTYINAKFLNNYPIKCYPTVSQPSFFHVTHSARTQNSLMGSSESPL